MASNAEMFPFDDVIMIVSNRVKTKIVYAFVALFIHARLGKSY